MNLSSCACIVGLLLLADVSAAGPRACPTGAEGLLFIQRNKNANEVHYDACLGLHGSLDPVRPVDSYWVIDKGGHRQREEINGFENKAYGFKVEPSGGGKYDFTMKVMKKRKLSLVRAGGHWRVAGTIGGKSAYLRRIYVYAKETWPFPEVQYVDVFGEDAQTGAKLQERILPGS